MSGISSYLGIQARDPVLLRAMDVAVQVAEGGPQDMLRSVFWLQERLLRFGKSHGTYTEDPKVLILAMIVEAVEALQSFSWKPWKKPDGVDHSSEVLAEMADVLHFFVEVCLAFGLTADQVYGAYRAKCEENTKRIQEGY